MISAAGIIDDLLSSTATVEINLTPLGTESSELLLAEFLGRRPEHVFALASHEATGGNPFLLTELARSMREHDVAPVEHEAIRVAELAPRSVVRRVRAQLRRLAPSAEALVRAAAVLGLEADQRLATELAGLDPAAAGEAADALYKAGVFSSVDPLMFEHAVVRSAIISELPPARLADDHGRAAQLLMREGASADRVAAHLLRTPVTGSATVAQALLRAAEVAQHRGDPASSIVYLERALNEAATEPPRWQLLHRLGCAAAVTGRPSALEDLRAAYASCPPAGQPRVALALGDLLARSGATAEAYEVLTAAIDAVGDSDSTLVCLLEATLLTICQVDASLTPKVRPRIERLQQVAADSPEARALLATVAYVKANDGGPQSTALTIADRVFASGEALRQTPERSLWTTQPTEWLPFGLLSRALATLGDIERSQRILDWIFDGAARLGSIEMHLLALVAEAALSYTVGDIGAAADDVATVIERSVETGSTGALPLAAGMRAATAIERGDHVAALAWLSNVGLLGPLPALGILDVPLYFRGLLRAEHGDLDAGLEDLFELGRREQTTGYRMLFTPWRIGAASVLVRAGRADEARPLIDDELALARSRGVTWVIGGALRVKGLVEGGESGIAALEEAVAVLRSSPFRLESARANVDLGAALRRGNRRAEARAYLETGLELAARCGSTTLSERAGTELAATGARPRRVFVTGPDSLTVAERRVAELAAAGHSNPEIAQALFVSRKTIETHLSRVYQKLEITSRTAIAAALAGH